MKPFLAAVNLTTPGQSVEPSSHITLIVGPNNVGKSAVLAGIVQETNSAPSTPRPPGGSPVESIVVRMPSVEELLELVNERAKLYPPGTYPHRTYYEATYVLNNGAQFPLSHVGVLAGQTDRFGSFGSSMMLLMAPEGRGGVLGSTGLPDLMAHQQRTPLQMLWQDRELESKINNYMQRAFGRQVLVNRHAGSNIHLQIGEVEVEEPRIGERSNYLDEAMKLPHLSAQGAGMQAFMGTVMILATGQYDVVLMDEPETFLHPPQARLLGEIVAEMSQREGTQVLVATHSDDFVQGVLNASKDAADVSVVRLTRPSDNENRVAQVAADSIKSLYRDPLLRYSSIMNGIFYKGVVVCEAESDCTYYSATLSHVEEAENLSASDGGGVTCHAAIIGPPIHPMWRQGSVQEGIPGSRCRRSTDGDHCRH